MSFYIRTIVDSSMMALDAINLPFKSRTLKVVSLFGSRGSSSFNSTSTSTSTPPSTINESNIVLSSNKKSLLFAKMLIKLDLLSTDQATLTPAAPTLWLACKKI